MDVSEKYAEKLSLTIKGSIFHSTVVNSMASNCVLFFLEDHPMLPVLKKSETSFVFLNTDSVGRSSTTVAFIAMSDLLSLSMIVTE